MNDIIVRELAPKDFDNGFPGVLSVLAPVQLGRDRALTIFYSKMLQTLGKTIFVALDGETVVGTATLLIEQKFIHSGGRAAHVEDVAVREDYQGAGVGCQLVGKCIDIARERGCYKVILNCDDEVVGFYEKLGFRVFCNVMRYDIE